MELESCMDGKADKAFDLKGNAGVAKWQTQGT